MGKTNENNMTDVRTYKTVGLVVIGYGYGVLGHFQHYRDNQFYW
jgi:hypothetical protein